MIMKHQQNNNYEVSRSNDDCNDNFLLDEVGRFPEITENAIPLIRYVSNILNRQSGMNQGDRI
jgi:D-lyxose ketol-isomerase